MQKLGITGKCNNTIKIKIEINFWNKNRQQNYILINV